MNNTKEESKFWAFVGKLFAILSVILALITIIGALSKSEYRLTAKGEYSHFEFPSFLELTLNVFEERELLSGLGGILGGDDRNSIEVAKNVLEFTTPRLSKKYSDIIMQYKSLWIYNLNNDTRKTIEEIKLVLADQSSGSYLIIKKGEKSKFGDFKEEIKVGTLYPSEGVKIYVWSCDNPRYNNYNSKVVYLNGFDEICYPLKIRGFFAWLYNNRTVLLLFIIISAILNIFCICYYCIIIQTKKRKKIKK